MNNIKVGDCLYCFNKYSYKKNKCVIGEKFIVEKLSIETTNTFTKVISIFIKNSNNATMFFPLKQAKKYFITLSMHRKMIIKDLL